jgi:hypothetical protein
LKLDEDLKGQPILEHLDLMRLKDQQVILDIRKHKE